MIIRGFLIKYKVYMTKSMNKMIAISAYYLKTSGISRNLLKWVTDKSRDSFQSD